MKHLWNRVLQSLYGNVKNIEVILLMILVPSIREGLMFVNLGALMILTILSFQLWAKIVCCWKPFRPCLTRLHRESLLWFTSWSMHFKLKRLKLLIMSCNFTGNLIMNPHATSLFILSVVSSFIIQVVVARLGFRTRFCRFPIISLTRGYVSNGPRPPLFETTCFVGIRCFFVRRSWL